MDEKTTMDEKIVAVKPCKVEEHAAEQGKFALSFNISDLQEEISKA